MATEATRQTLSLMNIDTDSNYELIRRLVLEGAFDSPLSSAEVVRRIQERFGKRIPTSYIQTYMRRFMEAGVIRAVKPNGSTANYYVIGSIPRQQALGEIGKERRVLEVEEKLFSDALTQKLGRAFEVEVDELRANFGRHGNATAFLLRKMLEKLLIIVFGKINKDSLISDSAKPGGWRGLQEIIDIASREKVSGIPILSPKTAAAIKGIKFLGDAAAHNPLVGVDTVTILPQMPFIITAYEELAQRL
jgi:hypothetical protein